MLKFSDNMIKDTGEEEMEKDWRQNASMLLIFFVMLNGSDGLFQKA